MVHVGLILKIVKDNKKILAVKQEEWRSLCSSGGLFFDQGYDKETKVKPWFVCNGVPNFSPTHQINKIIDGKLAITQVPFRSSKDRKLSWFMGEIVITIDIGSEEPESSNTSQPSVTEEEVNSEDKISTSINLLDNQRN